MKASLKLTIQIIGFILVIFLVVPVFLPSGYIISATTDIPTPPEIVFNEVNVLKNRKNWSPFEQDSTMINHYEGPAAGKGARRIWTSRHTGNGTMEIIHSVPNRLVETKMNFGAPGKATGHWVFSAKNGITQVEWQMHIEGLQYPFGKWLGILLKKSLKQVLEKGLNSLKEVAKTKAGKPSNKYQNRKP